LNLPAVFAGLGGLCLLYALAADGAISLLFRLNFTLALFGVAFAYWKRRPSTLMKRADGTFSRAGWALFWPYFLANELSLVVFRWVSDERCFDEIVPGLYQGSRLLPSDAAVLPKGRFRAVLDLAAELQEAAYLRGAEVYLSLPLLDATAPEPGQLERALAFIKENLPKGPVYVHCAMGHGRSGTVVAAHLLSEKLAEDSAAALELIREKRPGARFNAEQSAFLSSIYEKDPGAYTGGLPGAGF